MGLKSTISIICSGGNYNHMDVGALRDGKAIGIPALHCPLACIISTVARHDEDKMWILDKRGKAYRQTEICLIRSTFLRLPYIWPWTYSNTINPLLYQRITFHDYSPIPTSFLWYWCVHFDRSITLHECILVLLHMDMMVIPFLPLPGTKDNEAFLLVNPGPGCQMLT